MTDLIMHKTHKPIIYDLLNSYLNIYWNNIVYYQKLHDPEFKYNHGFSIEQNLSFANDEYDRIKNDNNLNKIYIKKGHEKLQFRSYSNLILSLKSLIKDNYIEYSGWLNNNNYIAFDRLKRATRLLDLLRQLDNKYNCINVRYFNYL